MSQTQLRAFGRGLHGGLAFGGGTLRLAEVTEAGVECREVGKA